MDAFITELTTAITPAALGSALASVAGLIVVGVLFSVGVHYARRAVSKLSRGKGGF